MSEQKLSIKNMEDIIDLIHEINTENESFKIKINEQDKKSIKRYVIFYINYMIKYK
jgi:hypothetical protein